MNTFLVVVLFLARMTWGTQELFGGDVDEKYQYDFTVHFERHVNFSIELCSAVVIAPTFVLTAAHCVDDDIVLNPYITAAMDVYEINSADRYRVKRIIIHPNYESLGAFDIALLELEKEIHIHHPIVLDNTLQFFTLTQTVTAFGYGGTRQLEYAPFSLVPPVYCKDKYWDTILKSMDICVESSFYKTTVPGDSGGPLILYKDSVYPILLGISSYGNDKDLMYPSVYTSIYGSKEFIDDYSYGHRWLTSLEGRS